MSNKQSSIEFLWDELKPFLPANYTVDESVKILSILKQAKEMEKEQMIEFAKEVFIYRYYGIQERLSDIANDIYNETYGGKQ